ncbi:MAG: hypothetical protein K2L38_07240 [Dysosmobacter sp.]|nr:hypothetical protein [Dysosmobacter sp.]
MSYYTNAAGRCFRLPEPSLDEPEYDGPHYCDRCERPLDAEDPWPLCWVCAMEEGETYDAV